MARIYKRTRRKTGPHSWQNITHRIDGTTFTSSSTKMGGFTTNISPKGVRKTTNNKGWIQTSFAPAYPKPKKSGSKSRSKKSNAAGFLGTLLFGTPAKPKKKHKAAPKKKTTAALNKSTTYVPKTKQYKTAIVETQDIDLHEEIFDYDPDTETLESLNKCKFFF